MLGFFLSKGEVMSSEILLDALERRQQERQRVKDLETALATQSQNIDTLRKTVERIAWRLSTDGAKTPNSQLHRQLAQRA